MNIFFNEYFGFCFELNFELNHLPARFNEKMNFQKRSPIPRPTGMTKHYGLRRARGRITLMILELCLIFFSMSKYFRWIFQPCPLFYSRPNIPDQGKCSIGQVLNTGRRSRGNKLYNWFLDTLSWILDIQLL